MSYIVKDNYGKKAYIEVENLKKDINRSSLKNNDCIQTDSYYKINSSENIIIKEYKISGKNAILNVNMYTNTVNFFNNIRLYNNGILIYSGIVGDCKNIKVANCGEVIIAFEIDNVEAKEFDADVVINTVSNDCLSVVQKFEDEYYLAVNGLSETLIYQYESINDLVLKNHTKVYLVPIKMFDFKILKDSSCFVGSTLVLVGVDSNNILSGYCLDDEFSEARISLNILSNSYNISSLDQYLYCAFVKNNNIYLVTSQDDFNNQKILNVANIKIKRILDFQVLDLESKNFLLLVQNYQGKLLLINYSLTVDSVIGITEIGKFEYGKIYIVDNVVNVVMVKENKCLHKKIVFKNGEIVSLVEINSYFPCTNLYLDKDNILVGYNNCFTSKG